MPRPRLPLAGPLALLLALLAAAPALAAPETAEEIEACVRKNLPRRSSIQTLSFRSTDRVGSETGSTSTLWWELFDDGLSKLMLRFTDPSDLRGAGLLMLEQADRRPDTILYLPSLGKSRRVSSRAASSSLFGTDFSYEDFERLMGMSKDARRERLEDDTLHDRPVWVVAGHPGEGSASAYERVVSWVDQQTCVPLKSESYEPGGRLRKRLEVDVSQISREGERWVPRHQTMHDLRDQTSTELVVEEIELDAEISRKMFSERELERAGR
jgi:hypothetical protein